MPFEEALPIIFERVMGRRHFAESGCIEYTGYVHKWGYGYIQFQGKNWKVHRLVWTAIVGPIPDGGVIMHSCDNRKCINMDHLSLGTQQANIRDCAAKKRQASNRKTHCPKGHAYAEHAIYYTTKDPAANQQANPWRRCGACIEERHARARAETAARRAANKTEPA